MDPSRRKLLRDVAKAGGKVMFFASEDACPICLLLVGRVFDPAIAPGIPVRGCKNTVCRCDYLPVPSE
jgi:hypothetical protein